ncbi:prepilin-type N-terminal cleavage/methylation domain-containing protein [Pseudomonas alcaligenes]|uniref:Prepilin-type N-terminal cleavage/methylation domain-containing protein n=1 Tax=Aquipseudomonas alcaligenes TaxID=43263 RepID=A0ABR7S4W2_AQUAC|nr:type II secretion system protein [Pseudomonas alcaligenes]MBC9252518.1 prepilin-type N-terminal cleavage/methylation domain-containing protein [Pseudomonas alcaligenes]
MRGFTLVELVMVIVIIGILAVVVGPRFFDRKVFDERLFYEESLAAVRYGQKLAVSSGCLIQVSLSAAGYSVLQAANCTSGAYNVSVPGPDGQSLAGAVPSGVSVTADPTAFPVVFDSQGQPSAAASATIGTFSISVTATTGMVQ